MCPQSTGGTFTLASGAPLKLLVHQSRDQDAPKWHKVFANVACQREGVRSRATAQIRSPDNVRHTGTVHSGPAAIFKLLPQRKKKDYQFFNLFIDIQVDLRYDHDIWSPTWITSRVLTIWCFWHVSREKRNRSGDIPVWVGFYFFIKFLWFFEIFDFHIWQFFLI